MVSQINSIAKSFTFLTVSVGILDVHKVFIAI